MILPIASSKCHSCKRINAHNSYVSVCVKTVFSMKWAYRRDKAIGQITCLYRSETYSSQID